MATSKISMTTTASSVQPERTKSAIKSQAAVYTAVYKEASKFEIARDKYPFDSAWHTTEYIEVADAQELLSVASNFSDAKSFSLDLFTSEGKAGSSYAVKDGKYLKEHIERIQDRHQEVNHAKTAVFCVYLEPGVRYGNSKVSIDALSMEFMLSSFDVSPAAVADVFGRPDYWSPGHYVDAGMTEFWCQHPRWDIHNKEQPISVYMKYDSQKDLTVYIISGAKDDFVFTQLHRCLRIGEKDDVEASSPAPFVNPFAIHYFVARLSFEFSKGFVSRLRRTLYDQLDKIDQHTQSISTAGEREELKKRTTDLSLLSQNVDSFIAAFHMALGIVNKLNHAHEEYLRPAMTAKPTHELMRSGQRLAYSIRWLTSSLESQQRWLYSYKARKDTSMTLVYNLVTQQDSSIMIQDSSSMKGIAILTMVFLPGTFTSSLLSCGILSESNGHVETSGLWWFWFAATLPLTIAVMSAFLLWYRSKKNGLQWKDLLWLGKRNKTGSDIEKAAGRENKFEFEKKRA